MNSRCISQKGFYRIGELILQDLLNRNPTVRVPQSSVGSFAFFKDVTIEFEETSTTIAAFTKRILDEVSRLTQKAPVEVENVLRISLLVTVFTDCIDKIYATKIALGAGVLFRIYSFFRRFIDYLTSFFGTYVFCPTFYLKEIERCEGNKIEGQKRSACLRVAKQIKRWRRNTEVFGEEEKKLLRTVCPQIIPDKRLENRRLTIESALFPMWIGGSRENDGESFTQVSSVPDDGTVWGDVHIQRERSGGGESDLSSQELAQLRHMQAVLAGQPKNANIRRVSRVFTQVVSGAGND